MMDDEEMRLEEMRLGVARTLVGIIDQMPPALGRAVVVLTQAASQGHLSQSTVEEISALLGALPPLLSIAEGDISGRLASDITVTAREMLFEGDPPDMEAFLHGPSL